MKTLVPSSSEAVVLLLTTMGLCLCPQNGSVCHSARDDAVYTLAATVSERLVQHRCPMGKVQRCWEESGLSRRRSDAPAPTGLTSEELQVLLLTELLSSLGEVTR